MKMFSFVLCLLMIGGNMLSAQNTPESNPRVIILLGPPGSGKGTQASKISEALRIPHISTGDLFRENLKKDTELGKRARVFMDKGQLVPDEIVLEMLFTRVAQPDSRKGYLLDGFPRTIPQAEALDRHLDKGTKVLALNLDVSDETIFKRMAGRLTCRSCGNIQNRFLSPPQKAGICDKCQGELYQRTDDAEDVVKERLRVYHNQTEPLISYYQKKGVLINVNGENPPEQVFKELMKSLNSSK